jgi:adenylylsulfate kinase-like enzyme
MAEIVGADAFVVVHLSAPLEVCRERHAGALYRLAASGEIGNVPGVSAPYEAPRAPALVLPTHEIDLDESVQRVLALLEARAFIAS